MPNDLHKFPDVFATDDMAPVKFYVTDEFWVELKPAMSIGEYEAHEASLIKQQVQERGIKGGRGSSLDFTPGYVDFLTRNIVDWSADSVVTAKSVSKLRYEHYKAIAEEIDRLNGGVPFEQELRQGLELIGN